MAAGSDSAPASGDDDDGLVAAELSELGASERAWEVSVGAAGSVSTAAVAEGALIAATETGGSAVDVDVAAAAPGIRSIQPETFF